MIKDVMHRLGGVNAFGITTIVLFFIFFIGMIVYAMCLKKSYVKSMSALPLEDETAAQPSAASDPKDHYE